MSKKEYVENSQSARRIRFRENVDERVGEKPLENLATPTGIVFEPKHRVRRIVKPEVRLKPHIGVLLGSSYNIIHQELNRLTEKQANFQLDEEELRRFVKLADATVKLAREEREQETRDDPGSYSDEELLVAADTARVRLLEGK
jgi:hypothetical protein